MHNYKNILTAMKNEKGIALITSLLLTLISLAMILVALYMVTQGTRVSGLFKSYKTGLEASYGAADFITKEFIPQKITGTLLTTLGNYGGTVAYGGITDACFTTKLTVSPATSWGCGSFSLDPTQTPDITLTLAAAGGTPYTVNAKIVDTTAGNTDTSGLNLIGFGVVEGGGGSSIITPQQRPYMYRIEIQGQRQGGTTTTERANLSLLYAY